jgi:transcriptional regulator with XRE-family HTH domain
MRKRPTRWRIGPKFSEGARLLWVAIESRRETQLDAARKLDMDRGHVARILYGDRLPTPKFITRMTDTYQIPGDSWGRRPLEPFTLPACRDSEAA